MPIPVKLGSDHVAEAARRGRPADRVSSGALHEVREPARTVPYNDRREEEEWMENPDPKYAGQFVVVDGSRVVSHATDVRSVVDAARTAGVKAPYLRFVREEDDAPFAGMWL